MSDTPDELAEALVAVTVSLPGGGEERPGQLAMAKAVARAVSLGRHLVVQAGTGTEKSLAYLLPVVLSGRKASWPPPPPPDGSDPPDEALGTSPRASSDFPLGCLRPHRGLAVSNVPTTAGPATCPRQTFTPVRTRVGRTELR